MRSFSISRSIVLCTIFSLIITHAPGPNVQIMLVKVKFFASAMADIFPHFRFRSRKLNKTRVQREMLVKSGIVIEPSYQSTFSFLD